MEGVSEESSVFSLVQLFFEETVGGILFGVIFGVISVYCLKRMIYDGVLVVTLMIIFTYAIYLIA
jgi:NhaP-type Na+/H+ or K+/H+ antiporter